MMSNIQRVRDQLNNILSKHGITDPKEQQEIIIEIINAFVGKR